MTIIFNVEGIDVELYDSSVSEELSYEEIKQKQLEIASSTDETFRSVDFLARKIEEAGLDYKIITDGEFGLLGGRPRGTRH